MRRVPMIEDAMDPPARADVSAYRVGRRRILQAGLGVGTAAMLGGALAACSTDDKVAGSSAEKGDIKIGFLTAFTGLESIFGETQFHCFELAVNQINAAGGISGRKISVVKEDDATNPS